MTPAEINALVREVRGGPAPKSRRPSLARMVRAAQRAGLTVTGIRPTGDGLFELQTEQATVAAAPEPEAGGWDDFE